MRQYTINPRSSNFRLLLDDAQVLNLKYSAMTQRNIMKARGGSLSVLLY